jgi:hypothetical protein
MSLVNKIDKFIAKAMTHEERINNIKFKDKSTPKKSIYSHGKSAYPYKGPLLGCPTCGMDYPEDEYEIDQGSCRFCAGLNK